MYKYSFENKAYQFVANISCNLKSLQSFRILVRMLNHCLNLPKTINRS